MKKTPNEIFEEYKKILKSIDIFTNRLVFVTLLFFFSTFVGFYTAQTNPIWTQDVVKLLSENFTGLLDKSNFELCLHIFFNNLSVSVMIISLFFLFGIAPVAALLSNGVMIGVVISYSLTKLSGASIFLALIPHGIFEIPAFFLAAGLSLHLSSRFLDYLRKKRRTFKKDIQFALRIILFIITPLLLIASIIETFLTPILVF